MALQVLCKRKNALRQHCNLNFKRAGIIFTELELTNNLRFLFGCKHVVPPRCPMTQSHVQPERGTECGRNVLELYQKHRTSKGKPVNKRLHYVIPGQSPTGPRMTRALSTSHEICFTSTAGEAKRTSSRRRATNWTDT